MPQVTTLSDALQMLCDPFNVSPNSRNYRMAQQAIRTAYRDFPSRHRWRYLYRRGSIVTSAPYSTGTIAYDHTGGASERLVTLTDGTWPDWARYGTILINSVLYKVASRESSTTLTLSADNNPEADIASGTTYTLSRSVYPLPLGFRRIGEVIDTTTNVPLSFVTPTEIGAIGSWRSTSGEPTCWTIRGVRQDYFNRAAIEFYPHPSTSRLYEFFFAPECRDFTLRTTNTSGGTVAVTSGSTAVTGTNTAFTADMVGTVFRVSESATEYPTGENGDNPARFESLVESVESTTALTLADEAPSTLSGVLWNTSDPIDIEQGPTLTFFLRRCEYEYALLVRDTKLAEYKALADEAQRDAMAADYQSIEFVPDAAARRYSFYTLTDYLTRSGE